MVDGERVQDVRETNAHYLFVLPARPGEPAVHYAGAGWTAAGAVEGPEDWWDYLDAFGRRLAAPLQVTVQGQP